METQQTLDDTVRLLELDTGHYETTTQELTDNVNTLEQKIRAQIDYEDQETARPYLANRNLEAESPTKKICDKVKKFHKKEKLTCLLQERKLTAHELQADPTQKQYEEIFSQDKIKDHIKKILQPFTQKKPN